MNTTQYMERKLEMLGDEHPLYITAEEWWYEIQDHDAEMTQEEVEATNWTYVDWLRSQKGAVSCEEAIAKLEEFEQLNK